MKKTINGYTFIGLKEGENNPTLIQSHSYFKSPRIEHSTGGIDLDNKFEYELFCKASEITEEQAEMIVEKDWDYLQRRFRRNFTPLESFATFLESNDMYLVNPMEKPIKPHPHDVFISPTFTQDKLDGMRFSFDKAMESYYKEEMQWQSYQSKTYKEILIFKMK